MDEVTRFIIKQRFEISCDTSLNVCLHSVLSADNPVLSLMFLSSFFNTVKNRRAWKFPLLRPYNPDSNEQIMTGLKDLDPQVRTEFVRLLNLKFSVPINEVKDFGVIMEGQCHWDKNKNQIQIGSGPETVWVVVCIHDGRVVIGYVVFDQKNIGLFLTPDSYIRWEDWVVRFGDPVIVVGLRSPIDQEDSP